MDFLQRKRKLVNNISILDHNERRHIFHILKKNNVAFTKNQNGYFFNFTNMEEKTLDMLEKCVDVIITHRQELQVLDEKRELQIKEFKEMISNTMKEKILRRTQEEIHKLKLIDNNVSISKNITRKINFKRKYVDPNTIDNEMKQYSKPPKYPKNTVYWRLLQKINSRTKSNTGKRENPDVGEEKQSQVDDDIIDDIDYSDDLPDDKMTDEFDDDLDHDIDVDLDLEMEDENGEDDDDDEDQDENNEDQDDNDIDAKEENEEKEENEVFSKRGSRKKQKTKNEEFNEKYLHFKTLLKTKGFTCIENSSKLKEESYIELDEQTGEIKQIN